MGDVGELVVRNLVRRVNIRRIVILRPFRVITQQALRTGSRSLSKSRERQEPEQADQINCGLAKQRTKAAVAGGQFHDLYPSGRWAEIQKAAISCAKFYPCRGPFGEVPKYSERPRRPLLLPVELPKAQPHLHRIYSRIRRR